MNNLNDPPRWNMGPDPRGGAAAADGNKWNYALLVPMLGLAAFRWIWTRECQTEIIKVKARYDQDMSTVTSNLEMKYRDTLTENRRAAAILELELEKERQRVQGYRQALISQSQQVMEERKQLQVEREALEQEKMKLLESGAAGAILQHALARESDWHQRASAMLKDLEEDLVERQGAYCNLLLPREHRLEMEKNLLIKVVKEPLGTDTDLEGDLKDIFKNDRYCAKGNNRLLNVKKMDKRKNGSLMWLYLRYWQLQVTMEAHKRAEDSILGVTPDNNNLK
ncbi:coiled-coil domain-containing protein 127a isoform X1 [Salvelinus namaycush]|uniref:Coiled-coil domain-containing protein 127a isoform X1 n=2 Tax=Salvelinus namaycush TaxID=8040 RepID=A0A8U0PWK9_SALNM|nr:coiled-coil domain-containing protein 127a isoform X1 [Salvelinus namaycush]